jgi:hypothetical protein
MFKHVSYESLNSRQRENYNFQKVSALLADYGFVTLRLSDDWNGADFIANHMDGTFLRVQLKSRWGINRKYEGKGLWMAFPSDGVWYLVEHDAMVKQAMDLTSIAQTESWLKSGSYSNTAIPSGLREALAPFRLGAAASLPVVGDE